MFYGGVRMKGCELEERAYGRLGLMSAIFFGDSELPFLTKPQGHKANASTRQDIRQHRSKEVPNRQQFAIKQLARSHPCRSPLSVYISSSNPCKLYCAQCAFCFFSR